MHLKNTDNRYGLIAILLHWILATLIIGLLILGIYMTALPVSLEKLKLYGWHKEYGMLVLLLALFRIVWRLGNTTPHLALPALEKLAAHTMHWVFYLFLFAMPITGWLITSSAGLPVSFFGLFTLPDLVSPNEQKRLLFEWLHHWLGYALIAAIVLHTSAALKHHFINKDDILRRIFP